MARERVRCWNTDNPLLIKYHDEEWGTPLHDDDKLFEFIVLDGFQAGLTWELILKRREALREAFEGFHIGKVAGYSEKDVERLMASRGMIKNRLKISAAIINAKKALEVQREHGSFDSYLWEFTGGKTIHNSYRELSEMPSESEDSRRMSQALRKRGFKFVGPTICYAFMQAAGLVNDHLTRCFRYEELSKERDTK
jgi:DNA-3-methyladenine glycosylase I